MNELELINGEIQALQSILDYRIKEIPDTTRFWMIRTKKGYFYKEFIIEGFVALAWNAIDSSTDLSDRCTEDLKRHILSHYPNIKRPTTVINKCRHFLDDIKSGDYIIIPSAKSTLITIALAGEYYEEEGKTCEIEEKIIKEIERGEAGIHEVSCPYKKRRKITPLVTLHSSEIDAKLYRTILTYHGISNLDGCWRSILGELYNSYYFRNSLNIVYHVKRRKPVGAGKLSKLLNNAIECWGSLTDEENISVHINVASPGPVGFL